MQFAQEVANRIRALAKESYLSVNAILTRAGVNKDFVNNLANKGTMPAVDTTLLVANYFGVSLQYLLTGEGITSCAPQTALSAQEMAQVIVAETKRLGTNVDRMLKACALKPSSVDSMKAGKMPAADKILTIARHLGLSVDYLVTGNEEANNLEEAFIMFNKDDFESNCRQELERLVREVGQYMQVSADSKDITSLLELDFNLLKKSWVEFCNLTTNIVSKSGFKDLSKDACAELFDIIECLSIVSQSEIKKVTTGKGFKAIVDSEQKTITALLLKLVEAIGTTGMLSIYAGRLQQHSESAELTDEEMQLIANFRQCVGEPRNAVLTTASLGASEGSESKNSAIVMGVGQ